MWVYEEEVEGKKLTEVGVHCSILRGLGAGGIEKHGFKGQASITLTNQASRHGFGRGGMTRGALQ